MYGTVENRRLARAIVEGFPAQRLDPLEVTRWPWHRTAFYLEWIDDRDAAEQEAAVQQAFEQVTPKGMVRFLPGASHLSREAT